MLGPERDPVTSSYFDTNEVFLPKIMISILFFSKNFILCPKNANFPLILPVSCNICPEKKVTPAQTRQEKSVNPSKTGQENMVTLQTFSGKICYYSKPCQ